MFWLSGDFYRILTTGEETGGKYAVLEITSPPQGGPPLHLHRTKDESIYVIDGDVQFQYGDERISASKGFSINLKKNVPHTFKNIGNRNCKMIVVVAPAGLEGFFNEVGISVDDVTTFKPPAVPQDLSKLPEILKKYDIELVE